MKNLFKVFLTVGALIFVLSCGGSSGGDVVTICDDAVGTWSISASDTSAECGNDSYSYIITVTQSVCAISVSSSSLPGVTFSGTVNGSNISWTGSYPEDGGGTTTITSMSATLSGNYLSGSSSWRWAGGSESCTGESTFEGYRY